MDALRMADLVQGTLDLLILRTLAPGPLHGWGDCPADSAELADRQAKFYALTVAGRRRLEDETAHWTRMATAIGRVLEAFSSP